MRQAGRRQILIDQNGHTLYYGIHLNQAFVSFLKANYDGKGAPIFFDLDNTLCETRQKISPAMKKKLDNLKGNYVVISGAEKERMEWQLNGLSRSDWRRSAAD